MKIVTSIDALKSRLLWATYQYMHENIKSNEYMPLLVHFLQNI